MSTSKLANYVRQKKREVDELTQKFILEDKEQTGKVRVETIELIKRAKLKAYGDILDAANSQYHEERHLPSLDEKVEAYVSKYVSKYQNLKNNFSERKIKIDAILKKARRQRQIDDVFKDAIRKKDDKLYEYAVNEVFQKFPDVRFKNSEDTKQIKEIGIRLQKESKTRGGF